MFERGVDLIEVFLYPVDATNSQLSITMEDIGDFISQTPEFVTLDSEC